MFINFQAVTKKGKKVLDPLEATKEQLEKVFNYFENNTNFVMIKTLEGLCFVHRKQYKIKCIKDTVKDMIKDS